MVVRPLITEYRREILSYTASRGGGGRTCSRFARGSTNDRFSVRMLSVPTGKDRVHYIPLPLSVVLSLAEPLFLHSVRSTVLPGVVPGGVAHMWGDAVQSEASRAVVSISSEYAGAGI